jgi:hypothetical protein
MKIELKSSWSLQIRRLSSEYSHAAVFGVPFIQKPDEVRQGKVGRHRHECNLGKYHKRLHSKQRAAEVTIVVSGSTAKFLNRRMVPEVIETFGLPTKNSTPLSPVSDTEREPGSKHDMAIKQDIDAAARREKRGLHLSAPVLTEVVCSRCRRSRQEHQKSHIELKSGFHCTIIAPLFNVQNVQIHYYT